MYPVAVGVDLRHRRNDHGTVHCDMNVIRQYLVNACALLHAAGSGLNTLHLFELDLMAERMGNHGQCVGFSVCTLFVLCERLHSDIDHFLCCVLNDGQ